VGFEAGLAATQPKTIPDKAKRSETELKTRKWGFFHVTVTTVVYGEKNLHRKLWGRG